MTVPEAARRETRYGLVYEGEGWFVLNARETRWRDTGRLGLFCNFEGKRNIFEKVFDKPALVQHAGDLFGRL